MLDSIYVANLPTGADAYLGYTGGAWPTFATLERFFPHAHLISMAINASEDAEGLDVENGDATIAEIYGWFIRQQARGVWRPIVYHSAYQMNDVVATMTANGFARASYRLLSAHYGAGEHICGPHSCGLVDTECDGTQFTDTAPGLHGSQIDASVLADDFFAAKPAPKPKPKPKPAPKPAPAPTPFPTEDPVLELDSNVSAHPLLIPFGCPSIDLLSVATEGTPTEVTVTWLDEGNKPVGEKVSWGAAGSESSITVPKGLKKARLDVVSGGGPRLSIRFNPPAT